MRSAKLFRIIILLFCFLVQPGFAQELTREERIENRKARKQEKIDKGKFMITPIVGPGYVPELGFLITAGGLLSFKTNPADTIIQRSSIPVIFGISTTGAIIANANIKTFWFKDRLRFNTNFWYKDMPDHYFGVGYYSAYNIPKGDSTTKYMRQWFWVNPQIKLHLRKHFFLGLNIDINATNASSVNPLMKTDPYFLEYGPDNFNSGLGVLVEYDSRDRSVNAWKGLYVNLMATFFGKCLGGSNKYQIYQFDVRYYQKIKKEGRTVAIQAFGRFGNGNVPWGELSQLGSPFDLRGYRWGRYRDMAMVFFIAEYRHMFWRKKINDNSRFGFVAWAGTGSVGKDPGDFTYWLPNVGVGIRFELQPRMNIRLDFGIGEKSYGFYFQYNEAY